MSWIRSSKGATLLAVLLVAVTVIGVVSAASVTTDAPAEAQVGEEITVSATVTSLYSEDEEWRLNGTTQLEDVTGWEVTKVTPSGQENTTRFDGSDSFEVEITEGEDLDYVNVSITGTVPAIDEFSYDPPQSFVAADLLRVKGNNENSIETVTVHHYTTESKQARDLLDEANVTVSNSSSDEANSDLDGAISSYENENFPNSMNLSQSAIDAAQSTEQSEQTMQLILYAIGAIVVLGLLGGGVYYWRSQREEYDKLR